MSQLLDVAAAAAALLDAQRQTKRLLRMHFPHDDAPDTVLLAQRLDAFEALSRDFLFTVEVLSTNPRIALKDMQGKNVTVSVVRPDGTLRYFNGYVFEFRQTRTDGSYFVYDMILQPWLAYLNLRRDDYIFHGRNVLQQTEEIFADYDTVRDFETRLYSEIPDVTDHSQWEESDHNYLHRRWEELGWHYWYEHREDGHTLVLSDDSLRAQPVDGASPEVRWHANSGSVDEDSISQWTPVRRLVPSNVALRSFDFKNPRPTAVEVPTMNQQGQVLPIEVYEYTGAYGYKDRSSGEALARRRIEEIEAYGKHFEARGNNRFVQPGRWYRFTEHYDAHELDTDQGDGSFLVLSVKHVATNNYLQSGGEPAHYENKLECIRKGIPWRPARGHHSVEPKIYALQTAIVVGPKGSEIHTDEYGRVRVQFHWDRVGTYDEKSSAWVRVSSSWTGNGFGFVGIPRVGQEVVVQFLDGNPDRPLVTGCVYNQHNMPPFDLPGGAHKTGIQTRSTPGGGGFCEMVIHDQAGQELINIYSQKDMVRTVLNNDSTVIQGPQQTIAVTTGTQATTVHGSISTTSETNAIQTTAQTACEITAKTEHVAITAATDIILTVGASKFHMCKDGTINIEGVNVTVKGSGKVDVNP
jgi:type VI secretion system secreted protein VgrG